MTHYSRWSLRSQMVFATVGLLTAICAVVGCVCYLYMSIALNEQLTKDVISTSSRTVNIFSSGSKLNESFNVGTLVALVGPDGKFEKSPFVVLPDPNTAGGGKAHAIDNVKDLETIQQVRPDGGTVDYELSTGGYRFYAVPGSDGSVLITGLSDQYLQQTLGTLLLTIALVSLGGILTMGAIATIIIRKAMTPLGQLTGVASRVAKLPLNEGEVRLAERVPPTTANEHTEIGTVGLALNKMLDNVASALESRQRSETKVRQFVADASHELRTPLTAIRGYTDMLKMTEELSPRGDKSLDRVASQARRMSALVEDLLTLARLDEGRPLKLVETDVGHVVVETINDMKVASSSHHWKLEIPSNPVILPVDPAKLRQVLLNLFSNAAKHTDPGTTVTAVLIDNGAAGITLKVIDNGPGIPEKFQEHIFDRFTRADTARSGHDGTTGLGLSIVQGIVAAHGGDVSLTSQPGNTSFVVNIPRTTENPS